MPQLKPLSFQQHKTRWNECMLCDLCKTRKTVVLLRGAYPAPVLFIGEAPGESEDVLGRPFVGPAGKLMDRIIVSAGLESGDYALTNLIACIPRVQVGNRLSKAGKPPKFAIEACANRLRECVRLVQPLLIVWVGEDARTWGPKVLVEYAHTNNPYVVHILHPGAIIRMQPVQQPMAIKRNIVTLRDAWELTKE